MAADAHTSRALQALRFAWFAAWLAVGTPLIVELVSDRSPLARLPAVGGWLLSGVAALVLDRRARAGRRDGLPWLALQSAGAIAVTWGTGGHGLEVVLFVIAAAQAPSLLSWRGAVTWVVAQTLLAELVVLGHRPAMLVLASTVARLGFQAVALGLVAFAGLEARARNELAYVNEELRSAQARLAEHVRLEERLRIARDLHDTLGHHLTALALNLEVASHLVDGRSAPYVTTAQALTRTVLGELRAVVGAIREPSCLDLAAALRALVRALPAPRIHLELPEGLQPVDAERARTVFHCVQEIVTNARRHADAENLWIDLRSGTEGLRVHARDDGRGVSELRPGNGLAGMRERLEEAGGSLEIASAADRGFELWAFVPGGVRT